MTYDEASHVLPPGVISEETESILVRKVEEVFAENHLAVPEGRTLLHINCEGCEFDVVKLMPLERMPYVQIATHVEHVTNRLGDNYVYSQRRYCAMHREMI